jgi:hypothetical protein
VKLKDEDALA